MPQAGAGELGWEWGVIPSTAAVSFGGDENILKLFVIMVVQLSEYTKNHWIVRKAQ